MKILPPLARALPGAAARIRGRREAADGETVFDPADIGDDIDRYLSEAESALPGLHPGARKQVIWADPARKARTSLAIVYAHGFSASLAEIRPVPDLLARRLGANLFYTRLTGHAQGGAALARARAADWRADMAEALEIGRRIGRRVVVIGTSMGGALTTLALTDPALSRDVAGAVLVSPAYRLRQRGAWLLDWPFARALAPLLAGPERSFTPRNEAHGRWWTARYPTVAVLPLAAVVRAARAAPVEGIRVPALFLFADADAVIDAREIRRVAARWGGPATLAPVRMGPRDDAEAHVIAGDILSPGRTEPTVARMIAWIRDSGLEQ